MTDFKNSSDNKKYFFIKGQIFKIYFLIKKLKSFSNKILFLIKKIKSTF